MTLYEQSKMNELWRFLRSFFGNRPKCSWNDRIKLSYIDQNV